MRVQLVDHPHEGKFGDIKVLPNGNVNVSCIMGKDMVKIKLEEGGSCFAEAWQFRLTQRAPDARKRGAKVVKSKSKGSAKPARG